MNNTVLITGATGGVGTSICRHLDGKYNVLAVGRNKNILYNLCKTAENITPYIADISNPEVLEELLDMLLARHGYIPYVINNAGIMITGNVTELETKEMQSSLQVNVLAPFRIMQRLLQAMLDRDYGRIINITSGAPLNCFAGYSAYSVSKGALNALTVTAAKEHLHQNIKINLMSPGPVRSGMAPNAPMNPEVCHPTLDFLLNLDADGPTGRFFWLEREIPLFPDLEGLNWLKGTASERFARIMP